MVDDVEKTLPNEPLPPPDDDTELPVADEQPEATRQRAGADDDDDQRPAARGEDPERDDIVALYRKKRDEEKAQAAESAAEADDEPEDGAGEEAAPVAAKPQDGATSEPKQTAPADEIELVVDGKTVKKSLAEVKALAQINLAADNRLDEAKRILNEARAVAKPEHQPDSQPKTPQPGSDSRPEHQPAQDLDPEMLTRIVERIQVGDADEGREALTELIGLVKDSAGGDRLTPEQIDRRVQEVLVAHQTQSEIDTAAKAFEERFPEIAKDQDFRLVGLDLLARELRADLKGLGLSDEDLRAFGNDVRLLASVHKTARSNGAKLRPYGDVFNAVGEAITTKFNLGKKPQQSGHTSQPQQQRQTSAQPRVSETASERLERKRSAPQQPRTAGMRRPAPQQPARPKTTAEKIQDMRAARGFDRTA